MNTSSPDEDSDACAPFLLSQIGHEGVYRGDVSTITSPCFDAITPQQHRGSTLFDRISRGLSSEKGKDRRHSPATPKEECFDLSTIEPSQAERAVEGGQKHRASPNRQRWNGQCGSPPGLKPSVDRASYGKLELHTQSFEPKPKETASTDRMHVTLTPNVRSMNPSISHEHSVSWEISPSKECPRTLSQARKQLIDTDASPVKPSMAQRLEAPKRDVSMESSALTTCVKSNEKSRGSSHCADEWREVVDPETNRTYYYNRRTRVSRWRLPKGAVLAKKSNRRSDRSRSKDESSSRRLQQSCFSSEESQHKDRIHTTDLSSVHQTSVSQDMSNKRTNQISFSSEENQSQALQQQTRRQEVRGRDQESQRRTPQLSSFISHEESKLGSEAESYGNSFTSDDECKEEWKERYLDETFEYSSTVPHETVDSNYKDAVVEKTPVQNEVDDIKSPQDCSTNVVYCVYCGTGCGSAALLGSHLPECAHFAHMRLHGLQTQIELESVLFRAWSSINNSTDTSTMDEPNKSRNVSHSLDGPNATFPGASRDGYSDHDSYHDVALKTPTPRKMRREDDTNCVDRKSCPFCAEVFLKGNEFSSHLLKCTERRRARQQRRTKKKESPIAADPRMKPVTPGRRMPWE